MTVAHPQPLKTSKIKSLRNTGLKLVPHFVGSGIPQRIYLGGFIHAYNFSHSVYRQVVLLPDSYFDKAAFSNAFKKGQVDKAFQFVARQADLIEFLAGGYVGGFFLLFFFLLVT